MKPLVIGMDAKRAVLNATGLGNYSRYAVDAVSGAFPEARLRLYTPRVADNPRLRPLLARPNVELAAPRREGPLGHGALWRTWGMAADLRADAPDVYHGLSNELPLSIGRAGCASVVTVHDVIWRRVPEDYSAIDRRLYDWKYGESARRATRVIAISERTKADIIADFGIAPEKIDVIYQGVAPCFRERPDDARIEEAREALGLPERYIVQVGRVEGRKNQLLTVKALRALPPDVKLLIAGPRRMRAYVAEIERYIAAHGLRERVIWTDGVDFDLLPAVYAGAQAVAYPSRYEGFGLPVAEALGVGTPVVAATGSCLEEAGGEGALYVHPDDADGMADALRAIVDDSALRERLAAAGAGHVGRFTMEAFAEATMRCYRCAIEEYNQHRI